MSRYLFSNFKSCEFQALYEEISKVFDIKQEELNNLYQVMREEFEVEGYPEHTINRNIFRSGDPNFQKLYDEALIIGIDIPSILELDNGVSDKKTVVILGQDPRRRSNKRREEIVIGTPYAMHLKNCREKLRNTRLYFDLIQVLLEEGYRVYLTDVFKIWVSEPNNGYRSIGVSEKDCDRSIKILQDELNIFEPIALITWGKKANETANNLGLKIKHLPFPHPSGAANGTWRKLLGKTPTRENKVNFWKQTVIGYLNDKKL
ncbi:MAG: uracil-DNA glycosylase family protein [Nostoc sp. ChiSLP02]|nr:uracil-DNA glycosylase family protein [Nostoc sp. DedSLP05]MDZ8098184.1 uracil-DNA glycosylase family protein [Nostoc sp. DedSLP01]MDZ8185658.1 uracil-DNA glycosylase family protein [Nostoc sp. ChiSLP02]